mmetsp:Transcript_18431/g.45241  ORF Transcript_18431/g.45241 Transcript_18431/m.45241 type:complete len:253 (-) Transcript_18431:65-823(-)
MAPEVRDDQCRAQGQVLPAEGGRETLLLRRREEGDEAVRVHRPEDVQDRHPPGRRPERQRVPLLLPEVQVEGDGGAGDVPAGGEPGLPGRLGEAHHGVPGGRPREERGAQAAGGGGEATDPRGAAEARGKGEEDRGAGVRRGLRQVGGGAGGPAAETGGGGTGAEGEGGEGAGGATEEDDPPGAWRECRKRHRQQQGQGCDVVAQTLRQDPGRGPFSSSQGAGCQSFRRPSCARGAALRRQTWKMAEGRPLP